ncbi:MAG: DNA polymerase III subunit delta [Bacteroidales bacterium]|jgi:DNA polymerase-3 subunit delta'|nr:DNA polymerase III subunit delta [Bacteroidales bacterium]
MRFKDVIGQDEIKAKLVQAFKENRVSHSYLFYGAPGVGKMALAIAFAQYLSCENKEENDSCGHCPSCQKYEKLVHPDLHFVYPHLSQGSPNKATSDTYLDLWRPMVNKSPYFSFRDWTNNLQSENKQCMIYAAESESIIKKISLKTYESDYKIMIVWLPEKMNAECANKILKVLEEPPLNTVFMLVSNNREDILPTIQSRTQPIKVLGIADEPMKHALIERYGLSEEDANDIVKISNGSIIEARQQIEQDEENAFNFENFTLMMRLSYAGKVPDAIELAKSLAKLSRERQKSFLEYSLIMTRENFVRNKSLNLAYLTKDEEAFASKFSRFINERNVNEFIKIFNDSYYQIERNGNSEIIFADTIFNIMRIIRL